MGRVRLASPECCIILGVGPSAVLPSGGIPAPSTVTVLVTASGAVSQRPPTLPLLLNCVRPVGPKTKQRNYQPGVEVHPILTPDRKTIQVPFKVFHLLRRMSLLREDDGETPQIMREVYRYMGRECDTLTEGLRVILGDDMTGPAWVRCSCLTCLQERRPETTIIRHRREVPAGLGVVDMGLEQRLRKHQHFRRLKANRAKQKSRQSEEARRDVLKVREAT